MDDKKSKILSYVTGFLGLIGLYFFVRIMMVGDTVLMEDADAQNSILSPFITYSVYLLILTAAALVVFSIYNLTKDRDLFKRTMMGIAIMGVLLVIAYVFASDAASTDALGNVMADGEAGSVSKWVSTLINYSFILGAIGLVLFLFDFVKSLVK
jgi:glucan phosphoethanolaminetransferase (alkaline phosphatase superfamily)